MKQEDQNRLSMWWAVRRHLAANSDVWNGNEPFFHASEMLTEAIERARAALDVQAGTSKGISTDRTLLKNDAINQTVAIAKCTKVYAMDTGNSELHSAVNYGKAVLSGMSHHQRAAQLRTMIAAVLATGEDLLKFGVSPEHCKAAMKAVVAMEEAQSVVRTAITSKKAVTQNVPEIMEYGYKALTRLDNLIHLFEVSHPEFVAGYKTARAIQHVGIRHKDDASSSTEAA